MVKKEELSDSDRVQLDELLAEREFHAKLKARRTSQFESIKAWLQWIVAAGLGLSVLKDALSWLLSRVKEWLA